MLKQVASDRFIVLCHFDEFARRNLFHIQRFLTRNTGIRKDNKI
jgi:hypothetical protein